MRNITFKIGIFLFLIMLASFTQAQTWQVQNSGTTVDLRHVHFVSATTGWIAGHSGTVLKTVDTSKIRIQVGSLVGPVPVDCQ